MFTMVIYDIEETKNRNDLIKKLRHYGLKRIQKSVFSGYLTQEKRELLKNETKNNILGEKDSIIQLEICQKCKDNITQHGQNNIKTEENKDYEVLI